MDPNRRPPNGKGRGSFLLEMMKQKAQTERSEATSHPVVTPSVLTEQTGSSEGYLSQSQASSSSSNGGRGRALASLLKSMSSSSGSETREFSSPTMGHGRGALLDVVKKFG